MAPTNPQNSIRVCQSRPLRARREASIAKTAPTRRSQIAANSRSKPGRATPPPDRPRSSSMISDGRPAKLPGAIGKPVLPALALEVVHELIRGRLTDINASDALQMLGCDLAHG